MKSVLIKCAAFLSAVIVVFSCCLIPVSAITSLPGEGDYYTYSVSGSVSVSYTDARLQISLPSLSSITFTFDYYANIPEITNGNTTIGQTLTYSLQTLSADVISGSYVFESGSSFSLDLSQYQVASITFSSSDHVGNITLWIPGFLPPLGETEPVQTSPPEYEDLVSYVGSLSTFTFDVWQGVIGFVTSNWLFLVGLVCFVSIAAIAGIRKFYSN